MEGGLAVPGLRPAGHDVLYSGLRLVALLVGVAYAAWVPLPEGVALPLGAALTVFATYSALMAWWGAGARSELARERLYLLAAACDLAFVAVLLPLTGGAASPFYRALYVWVVMVAVRFGLRGGSLAVAPGLLLFTWVSVREGGGLDPWLFAVQAGGLLMHGPLVGFACQRASERYAEIVSANEALRLAQRRLAEQQVALIQQEKLATAGVVAAGVAHEVKNPLAGVIACTTALRRGEVPPGQEATYLEAMADGLERMRLTVEGLLDYARKHPPRLEALDPAEVCAACLRLLVGSARARGVEVEVAPAPGPLRVQADRYQLMQALFNVLLNAVDASPEGARVRVVCHAEGAEVGLSVVDQGPGFAPQDLPRLCEPFFTTRTAQGGSGLGLTITRDLLSAQGGRLTLENEPGAGARVTLWLPRPTGAPL